MAKWKIWMGLLVLFASGVLIGGVGTRMYVRHQIAGIFSRERPFIRNLYLRRLTRELHLTKEQRREVEQVANRVAEQFYTLRSQHRREVEAILEQSAAEIKKHLSPAQQKQFDDLRMQMRARRGRWRRGPRHRGQPPPPDMPGPLPPPPEPPAP